MPLKIIVFILFFTTLLNKALPCYCEPPVAPCGQDELILGPYIEYLIEGEKKLSINEIIGCKNMTPLKSDHLKFGFIHKGIWLRLIVLNNCVGEWILEANNPHVDNIMLYATKNNRIKYAKKDIGDTFPYSNREIDSRRLLFKVPADNEPVTYYIRLESTTFLTLSLVLWSKKGLEKSEVRQLVLIGVIISLMALLFLYNIILNIVFPSKEYLIYLLLIIGFIAEVITGQGIGFALLWPNSPEWDNISDTLANAFIMITQMIFAKYYLELNINFKKLSIVINVGIFLGIINLLIVAIFKSARYTPLTISIYLIFYFYLSVYSLYLRIIKNKPIYLYYFFSSFAFFAILIIGFLYVNGITDIAALIGKWSVVIGGILYFVIISIGLTINRSIMLRDLSLLSDQIALRNSKKESVPTATEEKIRKAISFINKNYTHDISREGLAANSDMNTDYFSRAFKIYTGKKINDYINDLRIQNAAHELKNRDKTVINIAFDAGFENLRTFNRAFLKVMGITPSDYRKKHRGLPTAG